MPPSVFERLQQLSIKATGKRVGISSSLASTEVIGCLNVYWPMEDSNNLGLPIPGNIVKLVPSGDKLEIRVKGNTVTQGYYKDPERTAESFDEEGFFKMGDAVRFIDPAQPARGLAFDGRIAEQFKLSTGTWVSAGTLRTQIVAATSPYVRDAVICGLNQSYIAVMLWPNLGGCAKELQLDPQLPAGALAKEIASSPDVVYRIRKGLQTHNSHNGSSSTRVVRFILLEEPPSVDALEITEKGYVNQRLTLERRSDIVQRLYAEQPDSDVYEF
jgi:feruloyl-CoA synthase